MGPDSLCNCPKDHDNHLCHLKKERKLQEFMAKKEDPAVYCLLCEELANSAEHVCSPVEL